MRAVVLNATPMGDSCVSACEGTATTVLVCRTISPFRPSRLNNWEYIHMYGLVPLRRALVAFALHRLSKSRYSIRSHPQSWHGLFVRYARSRHIVA